jgi:membrane-associated protease RseP (regulator of RpoE activity)
MVVTGKIRAFFRLSLVLILIFFEHDGLFAEQIPTTADGQRLLYLQHLDQRIADISWKVLSANAQLCPSRASGIGISLHDAAQYAPAYRATAIATFGFGDGLPAILAIAKSGPADMAGLRVGDRIASINGQDIAPARMKLSSKEDYAPIAEVMTRLENLSDDKTADLDVRRGQSMFRTSIRPKITCRSRVEVVPGSAINASSNGSVVQIYGKLVLWAKSDDELAIVIAHELAHNILEHNQRIDRDRIGVGLFAALGHDGQKLRDMEREADRYGLFLVARSGYDYRMAPEVWRRLSATAGLGGIWATTHPSGASREKSSRLTVAEIDRQRAVGSDIVP